jgi:mannose-6-phosphate isomerase-like protein (cupin superfamily)
MVRDLLEPQPFGGDTASVLHLFDDSSGCRMFAQRVLCFAPGRSSERMEADSDEVLYVLSGSGALSIGGGEVALGPGMGVYASHGTPWAVEAASDLELVSVLVRDPEPVAPGSHAIVDLEGSAKGSATAGREFTLGVCPEAGCPSVTQFVGFIPPGRAPDHFHRYDEVIYVLEGKGVLHVADEEAPLRPGACVHLPRLLVHSLENTGEDELRLLGVFRPAGSPAEAYYPDGTSAVHPHAGEER